MHALRLHARTVALEIIGMAEEGNPSPACLPMRLACSSLTARASSKQAPCEPRGTILTQRLAACTGVSSSNWKSSARVYQSMAS